MRARHDNSQLSSLAIPSLRIVALAGTVAFLCALAALLCVPGAWAAQRDWTVTFNGSTLTSTGSTSLNDPIAGLQPGDSATFNVALSNDCDDAANWYMKNSVLKSMEDDFAKGGSYTYNLTYTDSSGKTQVIIGNDTVAGEGSNGLFDATTATGDWFFLGSIPAHGQGKVVLTVALDPESHGNSYFDTSASLQLSFAAEIPGQRLVTESNGGSDNTTTTGGFRLPSTGDMIKFGLPVVVALIAIFAWVQVRRRSNAKHEGGK